MCGIWALLGQGLSPEVVAACLKTLEARGPDATRSQQVHRSATLGFTRLAINGLTMAGMQPFSHTPAAGGEPDSFLICNGEIYNYKALGADHAIPLTTGSDCEVLLPLYHLLDGDATTLARCLDGVFAIVIIDLKRQVAVVMRDPYGVRPLFRGRVPSATSPAAAASGPAGVFAAGDRLVFGSELKSLVPCGAVDIQPFPPGCVHTYDLGTGQLLKECKYHSIPWLKNPTYGPSAAGRQTAREALRQSFTAAVEKRLLSDRPVGALLSGGLDSSLVAALAQRYMKRHGKVLSTFSIGMPDSTDLVFARQVAAHIGSDHHEVLLTEDDFFDAIPEVVRAIESFDITSVRASVGNYLVSKYVREKTDVKVVFNGDGSDEAAGSYLYFYAAPSDAQFEAEVDRLLSHIHMYDVLRSDRSVSTHGLEARTPFLDRQFVSVFLSIATAHRRPVAGSATGAEKQLLREAFDASFNTAINGDAKNVHEDDEGPLLPHEVLWRRKEAFSDGVSHPGRSWYTVIQERMEAMFPGDEWKAECARYPAGPTRPYTRESLWYRKLFEESHGAASTSVIPYFWLPKWSGDAKDPSARTLTVYAATGGGQA